MIVDSAQMIDESSYRWTVAKWHSVVILAIVGVATQAHASKLVDAIFYVFEVASSEHFANWAQRSYVFFVCK